MDQLFRLLHHQGRTTEAKTVYKNSMEGKRRSSVMMYSSDSSDSLNSLASEPAFDGDDVRA
eukprot:3303138-Pyramimonas_sp.AAC.1